MRSRRDVLIVGGGLVGLAQALFCALAGVDCLLVERREGPDPHPRARGLNPRTMELLDQAGAGGRLRATASARALTGNAGIIAARTLADPEYTRLEHAYFMDLDSDLSALTPSSWCLCHQDEAEPVLADRAARLGAELRFGTELLDLADDGDAVRARLLDRATGTEHTVHAGYAVAADGARGAVRESLGIGTSGPGVLARFVNIAFTADLRAAAGGRAFVMCYLTGVPGGRAALMPVDGENRWLLHVGAPPGAPVPDGAACAELVRSAVGDPGLDVAVTGAAPWDNGGQVADAFAAGRVFLAGDAAHVMPPTGAFGSNTGIQDAHNLAWRLAAVLDGTAGPGLLDGYDAERRPVAAATVEQAVLRSRERPKFSRAERSAPDPRIVPDPAVIFGYRYGTGPDGVWGGPDGDPVGRRVPHAMLRIDGRDVSTVELAGPGFVLLTGPAGGGWSAAAKEAGDRFGLALRVHAAGAEAAATLGVGAEGALLVRPDGFVAWASGTPDGPGTPEGPAAALARLLDRVPAGVEGRPA